MANENPIYRFMKENNLTDKDEASFVKEYSTPEKSAEIYSFMTQNSLTDKSIEDFTSEYFPEKKNLVGNASQNGLETFGLPSYTSPTDQQQAEPLQEDVAPTPSGYVDEEESARLAQEMNPSLGDIETQQRVDQFGIEALSGQQDQGIGASLTSAPQPLGQQAPWVGAVERDRNKRAGEASRIYSEAQGLPEGAIQGSARIDNLDFQKRISRNRQQMGEVYDEVMEAATNRTPVFTETIPEQQFRNKEWTKVDEAIEYIAEKSGANFANRALGGGDGKNNIPYELALSFNNFINKGLVGLSHVPEFVNDLVADALNIPLNWIKPDGSLSIPSFKETQQYWSGEGLDNIASSLGLDIEGQNEEGIYNSIKEFLGKENIVEKGIRPFIESHEQYITDRYGDSVSESIIQGDYGTAMRLLANQMAESAPFMLLAATTGGAGMMAMGTATAAERYSASAQESELPTANILIDAIVHGYSDPAFAAISTVPTIQFARELFSRGGRRLLETEGKDWLTKAYLDFFRRNYIPASMVSGFVEETAIQVTKNLSDRFTGVNPDAQITDGLADVQILGATMPGIISTVSTGTRAIKRSGIRKEVETLSKENNAILNDINNIKDLTDPEIDTMLEAYQANNILINQYVEQAQSDRNKLSERDRQIYDELADQDARLEAIKESGKLSPESIKALEDQQAGIEAQIDDIASTPIDEAEADTPVEQKTPPIPEAETVVAEQAESQPIEPQAEEDSYDTKSPEELASLYEDEVANPTSLTPVESSISEWAGTGFQTTRKSYKDFGDRNKIKDIDKSYFSKNALSVDQIAKNINDELHNGAEVVSPQDVIDFMDKFNKGAGTARTQTGNSTLKAIGEAYSAKTGKQINARTAKSVAAKHRVAESRVNEIKSNEQLLNEVAKVMDEGGEVDFGKLEQLMDNDPEALTVFPGDLNETDINNLRQIIEYEKYQREQQAEAERESAVEGDGRVPIPQREDGPNERSEQRVLQESESVSGIETEVEPSDSNPPSADSYEAMTPEQKEQYIIRWSRWNRPAFKNKESYIEAFEEKRDIVKAALDRAGGDIINTFKELGSSDKFIQWYQSDPVLAKKDYDTNLREHGLIGYKPKTEASPNKESGSVSRTTESEVKAKPAPVESRVPKKPTVKRSPKSEPTIQDVPEGSVNASGQPISEPSQSVQVLDSENPARAAEVLEGSLERLTEGMTEAEINADPELVALKNRIDNLKQNQDAVSKRETTEIPLESETRDSPQVEQRVPEPERPARESRQAQEEVVSESVVQEKEAIVAPKSLIDVLSSSEARSARKTELSDRIRAFRESQRNLGFAYDPKQRGKEAADFTRDLIEFAAINIVDGIVSTAQQFADLVGVSNTQQIKDAFNTAKATVESSDPLAKTTARNIDTNAKREAYGFNERIPVTKEIQSDVLTQARKEIADGYNVTDLVSRINDGSGATSLETAILIEYAATAEASLIESTQKLEDRVSVAESAASWKKQVDRRAEIQNELVSAYDALQASGTANARAMAIRKAWVQRDLSLANMIIQRRAASGNTRLTDSQLQEVQRQFKELRDAYDAQKELLEMAREDANKLAIENALLKEKRARAKAKPRQDRALSRDEARQAHRKNIDSIKDRMREIARKSRGEMSSLPIKPELIPLVAEMAREYASIGIIDATQIVDNVYNEILDIFEGISKRDIMDAISGYGLENDSRKTRSQLQQDMYDIRRELRLLSQIEDVKKGVKRAKADRKGIVNQRLKDLQAELKTINQENAEATSEADTEAKRIKAAKNRLKKIQERVKSGDYKKEIKIKVEESPELKEINKKIRDTLWEVANENAKLELARRGKVKKATDFIMDVTSIPRQLMSSTDLSAILRQGAFTLSRPVMSAKAFVKGAKFWWSEEAYDSWAQEVAQSPGYQLMKASGLDLTLDRMNPKMAAREELFQSKLLERLPLIGKTQSIYGVKVWGTNIIGKSDRSYTGTLNHLRVDLFERGVELLEQNGYSHLDNPEAYKALAKYVNIATGRGNFGKAFGTDWANVAPYLSKFLFAPRFLLSRLQFLSGSPLYMEGTNNVIRKMYARDLAGYLGFGMTMLSLASVIGSITGDDDENDVEIGLDPNSTDFGKIKIGDTRIDVWAGSQQIAVLTSRMITGKYTTTTGNTTPLDGSSYNKTTRLDVLGRFARSKMSPISGLGVSALSGQNYMGERFQLGKEIKDILLPMAPMDIIENIKEIDNRALAALTVPISILGGSIQTYRANDFLQKGVDDKILDLLAKNKAMVIDPYEKPKQIYDIETGKQRFMNNAEYRKYSDVYLNKIKSDLEEKHDELSNLNEDKFDGKLSAIKRKATEMATQEASGVSNSMLKIAVKDKTYYLNKDQVKQRVDIQDKWLDDNKETRRQFENIYINAGFDKDQAKMEANKRMLESAEKYSRGIILKDMVDGKMELSEEKPTY